jgi:hypothetical protein
VLAPLSVTGHGLDAHTGRHLVGRTMLVERFRGDPVRIPLHHQRAVGQHRQDQLSDADVVAEQIALGQFQFRPECLAEIADLQRVAAGQFEHAVAAPLLQRVDLAEQLPD